MVVILKYMAYINNIVMLTKRNKDYLILRKPYGVEIKLKCELLTQKLRNKNMKDNLILYLCGGFSFGAALSTPNRQDCIKFLLLSIIILFYAFKDEIRR